MHPTTLISPGTLFGVGVGPGDPELLTLKAIHTIEDCSCIAIPSKDKESCVAYNIVKSAIPSIDEKSFLYISMPMTKDQALLEKSHRNGADTLESVLSTGVSIAFLTLGDPTIYSTYLYLHRLVGQDQYPTQIISGIPSFCAVSAALNTGLVEQSEPLHIYPGSYPIEESLSLSGTTVYMKSGRNMGQVKEILSNHPNEISMIENCGMDNEHIYHTLHEIPDQSSYYSILISKSKKP